jgi:hypothetical protein
VNQPQRRRRTVDDVAGPYANFLLAVPPVGVDTCRVCHGAVYDDYSICYPCNQAVNVLGDGVADIVSFVSLAPAGEQFARELYAYKRESVPATIRGPRLIGLAAVLWKWLSIHEGCMGRQVGASDFDLVTSVPSTSGRAVHPLEELVSGIVGDTNSRYEGLLRVHRTDLAQREQPQDRYVATRSLKSTRVLVIDDTWTTGAHEQSASTALKAAGADAVGVLALGRWFTTDFRDNKQWLADKRSKSWDWQVCGIDP